MLDQVFTDPWFWAFLAAVGWALAFAVTGTKTPGRSLGFGIFMFILAEIPRVILPLPFVEQPRITSGGPWPAIVGGLILAASVVFGTPVLRIVPLTAPDHHEPLRTNGLYAVVRHPRMLCDILWPLGWSMIFGSIIGVGLTAVWLLVIGALTHVEEESLVREYGVAYRDFQALVPRLLHRRPSRAAKGAASH